MPMRTNAPSVASQTNDEQRMVSPTMEHMARSMTSMSEMCQRMMQKEMASRPLITAAAVILGTLGVVALALFVVLEIQWIRFWNVHIKTERLKLIESKPS